MQKSSTSNLIMQGKNPRIDRGNMNRVEKILKTSGLSKEISLFHETPNLRDQKL